MSKLRVFGVAIIAAGILGAGTGLASAAVVPLETPQVQEIIAPGEQDPTGTGSSKFLPDLVKSLSSGSGGARATSR
ncbi:hypothetical protein D5S18_11180 [Nocardia panacis]|uniref:DUF2613 family protein n=1 Tax=Nocardia panacis TaxID=2340916 RepID=A0A3A4KN77_9NOCA|nr:hypothetical protein [Nocardia panacis]RJO76797.1 hypothetical protein D5S18_11180 [Nocardia panacis]